MKRFLLAGALVALATSAFAQVNIVPAPGLNSGYLPKTSYSSSFYGLVPASSATDLLCIAGSATKTVRVTNLTIGGTAGTLVSLPINVLRRATADTGGTAATTTANPGVTTQIASRDTQQATNASASATLVSYTVNPTINDAAPVYVDSKIMMLGLTGTTLASQVTVFDWSRDIANNIQVPTLRGAAQQLCVNLITVSVSSGVLNGSITWTEE